MDLTRTALGTWSGGRHLRFGEPLDEELFITLIRHAYQCGLRTYITFDSPGNGQSDALLGRALQGVPRDSYCLVGGIGRDFYTGQADADGNWPRFTHPTLRRADGYASYLRMAAEKQLQRCAAGRFDLLFLQDPDHTGFVSDEVWQGLHALKNAGLTDRIGMAPGPRNGYILDAIQCFERFGEIIDWAMLPFSPLGSWPTSLCLPAARENNIKIVARDVDHHGIFHDSLRAGHKFALRDPRGTMPAAWLPAELGKLERMRKIAEENSLTLLQLACIWCLSQPSVYAVAPTLIQEGGVQAKRIEMETSELAELPHLWLSTDECREILEIGDNKNGLHLDGANPDHKGEITPDRWQLNNNLVEIGRRWGIEAERDLVYKRSKPKIAPPS